MFKNVHYDFFFCLSLSLQLIFQKQANRVLSSFDDISQCCNVGIKYFCCCDVLTSNCFLTWLNMVCIIKGVVTFFVFYLGVGFIVMA